jgi:DNA-directed RNA polymerase subunit alpha
MRVGDRTDFNRLRILIETNGTISPREALENSIEIMIHQLKSIIGFQEEAVLPSASMTEEKSDETVADPAKVKVADLGLSTRITTALEEAGIKSAAGLARKTSDALKELDGVGDKAVEEIEAALKTLGLALKGE